jgi:hypothetical protein
VCLVYMYEHVIYASGSIDARFVACGAIGQLENMASGPEPPDQFRGWLMKWTNYLRGYQKRWFVLSNGLLSYYK